MKNFKKIAAMTIIIFSLSTGVGLYILHSSNLNFKDFIVRIESFINMKNSRIKKANIIKINEEYNYDLENKSELYVDSKISNINIKPSNSNDIKIKINGTINKDYYIDYLDIKNKGKKFEIKVLQNANRKKSILNLGKMNIEIIVPKDKFKSIYLNTVSGSILINDIFVDMLNIDSVSGDLHLDKTVVNELTCNLVSGNLYSKGTIEKINCDSVSGNISISSIKTARVETLSGNIDIYYKRLFNESNLNTISGDIKANFKAFEDINIDIESVSGDIKYSDNKISKERFYELFSFNKENNNLLNIQTVSGNIDIIDKN